jgi:hypothetical protein
MSPSTCPTVQVKATTGHDVKPFLLGHYMFWTGASLVPLLLAAATRTHHQILGAAFLLSCTVKGYLYGVLIPKKLKTFLHPIIICTAYSMGCCAVWGIMTGSTFLGSLAQYLPAVRFAKEHSAVWHKGECAYCRDSRD